MPYFRASSVAIISKGVTNRYPIGCDYIAFGYMSRPSWQLGRYVGFLIPFDDAVAGYTRRNSDNKRNDTFHVKYLYSVPVSGVYKPSQLATGTVFTLGVEKSVAIAYNILNKGAGKIDEAYPSW